MFIEELKKEIQTLVKLYRFLRLAYMFQNNILPGSIKKEDSDELKSFDISENYHKLYMKALRFVHTVIPERETDFINLNSNAKRAKTKNFDLEDYDLTLGIQGMYRTDFSDPNGLKYKRQTAVLLQQQADILQSALDIMDSKIYNVQGELQYNIFMNELDAAEHLLKNNFVRAAGAVCGVVLEGHLKTICIQHKIKITRKDDLSKYNDYLKNNGVITQPNWRKIQYLTDIRNTCDHKRDSEPTSEQVIELLNGTKQIISEID